jgi:hypothetical protein
MARPFKKWHDRRKHLMALRLTPNERARIRAAARAAGMRPSAFLRWAVMERECEHCGGVMCPPLGVDTALKWEDIRKLSVAAFGASVKRLGVEVDDYVQDVYRGVLARNIGASAWDPGRGTLGTYITQVARSVFLNLHEKVKRLDGREQVGTLGYDADGHWAAVDAADVVTTPSWEGAAIEYMDGEEVDGG